METKEAEAVSTFEVLHTYINRNGVERVLQVVLGELCKLPQLPDNPYALLLEKLRSIEFGLSMSAVDKELAVMEPPSLEPEERGVSVTHVRGKENADVWALPHVLLHMELGSMRRIRNQLGQLLDLEKSTRNSLKVTRVASLSGPCLWAGGLLPEPDHVSVSHDYVVEGGRFEQAVSVFARVIMEEMIVLALSNHHCFVGECPCALSACLCARALPVCVFALRGCVRTLLTSA